MRKAFYILLIALPSQLSAQLQHSNALEVQLALRWLGHQLLLDAGDQQSVIPPITIDTEGRFYLSFPNSIALHPDSLQALVDAVAFAQHVGNSFTLEVLPCGNEQVLYLLERQVDSTGTLLACSGRYMDANCYRIRLSLTQPISAVEQTGGLEKADSKPGFWWLLPLIGGIGLIFFLKKGIKQGRRLGDVVFFPHTGKLKIEQRLEELSGKELELFEVLMDQVNQTVSREELMEKVWQDQGEYMGRTLDVFISKLRKKLEGSQRLSIKNVRGVGYRMVLD